MIISHKYKFIFIKTKKTAGTSVEVFLSQFCSDCDIVTPILPSEEGHIPRNYKGYFNPAHEILTHEASEVLKTFKDLVKRNKFYNHILASRVKARIHRDIWASYFKFCVERNPWDKTLSHYHHLNHNSSGKISFNEYIKKGDLCYNYPIYTDGLKHEDVIVDYVARYENLSEELTKIFGWLGIPFDGALNIRAKSGYRKESRPYQEVFSQNHRKIIESAFEKEIAMHGYTYD